MAAAARIGFWGLLIKAAVGPVPSLRRRHLPILGTYFGYGALGFTSVAEMSWINQATPFAASEFAVVAVWLAVPWSIKMVFGQFVDSIPSGRASHRGWLLCGSGLVGAGLLLHAANVSGVVSLSSQWLQYAVASALIATGVVLQDVAADALTSEIVPRVDAEGLPRPPQAIVEEMAMIQVMSRFTLTASIAITAALAAVAARSLPITAVYLIGLIIPCLTATAALLGEVPAVEGKPLDWPMLAGGAAIAAIIYLSTTRDLHGAQETMFAVSLAVVCFLFWRIARELDQEARQVAVCVAIVVFAFRAEPSLGEPYRWYMIDVLRFDESFFGELGAMRHYVGLVGLWVMSYLISRNRQTRVLLWLVLISPLLALPSLALVFGVHHWTEANFGISARDIARFDVFFDLRVSNLSMIAMLTLTAFYAPAGRRATWFTLMASIMNLALVAGSLQTKYLGLVFPVERGDYGQLPTLALATVAVATIVPWLVALSVGRRLW